MCKRKACLKRAKMRLPSSRWNSTVKTWVKYWWCYWEKKYFTASVVTLHPTADTTVIHTPPIIPTIPHYHQQLVRTADTTTQTLAVAGKLIITRFNFKEAWLETWREPYFAQLLRYCPIIVIIFRDMKAFAFFVEVNTGTDGRTATVKNH